MLISSQDMKKLPKTAATVLGSSPVYILVKLIYYCTMETHTS
jgi:hypothetical protein